MLSQISSILLTFSLLTVGIYLTVKSNFFQIVKFPRCLNTIFDSVRQKNKSAIKSMLLALGGTIGVGNIAGVSAAISLGGSGSVFWIWVCGIIGMITKYAEVFLAVEFRPIGPYGYIKNTFKKSGKTVAFIFGISCVLSSIFIGNIIQSKAVIDTFNSAFHFDYVVCTIFIGTPVAILAFSSGEFIKQISSLFVPFVTILYIFMTSFIIIKNSNLITIVFIDILKSAFNYNSATFGILGFFISKAITQGISKGLFSHEAGQGSAPIAYSADINAKAEFSANLGVIEVFVDTGVISSLTAFAMLTSGYYSENGMLSAVNMFIEYFGDFGGVLFAISIYLFCIAAISGWIFYAKRSIEILFNKKIIYSLYSIISVMIIPFIALFPYELLWKLSDVFMLMMTLPNLISIYNYREMILKSIRKCNFEGKKM